jgi:WD40 repeat protein
LEKTLLYSNSTSNPPTLTSMTIHQKGRLACGAMDGGLVVISGSSGKSKKILKGHTGLISDVRLLGEGRRLISTSWDCSTRLWSLGKENREPKILNHSTEVKSLAIGKHGSKGAAGARDGEVKVFSLKTMTCTRNLQAHNSDVSGLFFSADGSKLVSTSWAGSTNIWDLASYELIRTLKGTKVRVRSICPLPDDSFLMGLHDGTILRISLEDGNKISEYKKHTDIVSSMMVDSSESRILSGSWDRRAKIWNIDSGREELSITLPTGISGVCWHPKDKGFYTADFSGSLYLWSFE